jgi:CRISPR system Cascade subunit CasD
MGVLLLRIVGPQQSWGLQSTSFERATGLEPTKSGVIGMLCAALGRDRSQEVDDLAALRMSVRCDRPGVLECDFTTARNVYKASGDGVRDAVLHKWYLADAAFLVALEGSDLQLLGQLHTALYDPHWPLCLGRKAYPPSQPVYIDGGLLADSTAEHALQEWPLLRRLAQEQEFVRVISDDPHGPIQRMDLPAAPLATRIFAPRWLSARYLSADALKPPTDDDAGGDEEE